MAPDYAGDAVIGVSWSEPPAPRGVGGAAPRAEGPTEPRPRACQPIIGIFADAEGSGKTTLAELICQAGGATRLAFADPLRKVLRAFLLTQGVSAPMADHYLWDDKGTVIPEVGKCARELLISLGTGWGRVMVSPDAWVRAAKPIAATALRFAPMVVFDDVRVRNEAGMIRDMGGFLVRICRPRRTPSAAAAALEGRLGPDLADYLVVNDGSIDDLRRHASRIADFVRSRCA